MREGVSAPLVFEEEGFGFADFLRRQVRRICGLGVMAAGAAAVGSLATWNVADPSFSHATDNLTTNALSYPGAVFSDLAIQFFGLGSVAALVPVLAWGGFLSAGKPIWGMGKRVPAAFGASVLAAGIAACVAPPPTWPLPTGLGGVLGDMVLALPAKIIGGYPQGLSGVVTGLMLAAPAAWLFAYGSGFVARSAPVETFGEEEDETADEPRGMPALFGLLSHCWLSLQAFARRKFAAARRVEPAWQVKARAQTRSWRRAAEQVELAEQAEEADVRVDPRARARIEPEFFAALIADARQQPAARAQDAEPAVNSQVWAPEETLPVEESDAFVPAVSPPTPPPGWDEPRRPRTMPGPNTQVRAYRTPSLSAKAEAARLREERLAVHAASAAAVWTEAPQVPAEPNLDFSEIDAEETFPEFSLEDEILDGAEDGEDLFGGDVRFAFAEHAGSTPEAFEAAEPQALPRVKIPAPSRPLPAAQAVPAPAQTAAAEAPPVPVAPMHAARLSAARELAEMGESGFEMPPLPLLAEPKAVGRDPSLSMEALQENARLLEGVLDDFGVKGEIIQVRPGPVVTLYELEPAPGIKSSRVIGLADDIARSMSAIAARVAVVPGRNAIGIELPNARRETVYLREMLASRDFQESPAKLALALGKTINGEGVVTDIAKMPHVLVAGTTGSGKSVAINTMILSLLYRMTPAQCRLIMIDPKMVELSVYDGIPHLLTPVVTDPKKAVVALKWTVREMEDRYRKMAKVGVRNVEGFNARIAAAAEKGEKIARTVQTGFDRHTGEAVYETEEMDLQPFPFIVVIIDEVADLMMVAGKDIEGAVQRLGQMARAAGIHVIMATQRPSVDVITGTIKANFPTRISFQVTSKIDSRTILGEQGAEQLLGQGDMLFMAGGGRTRRVHGPFVSDSEVEKVVAHLKLQGVPEYLDAITADDEEEDEDDAPASRAKSGMEDGEGGSFEDSEDPYDQAVAVVLRDGKASTSYIQRRLGVGYNRAASLIERMEKEGIVGPANHAGKREILVPTEEDKM